MDALFRNTTRAVATEGGAENRTRLLRLRVRSGDVAWERVLLAAFLGDPIAQSAAGRDAPEASKRPRRWARGLVRCGGEEACARAVVLMHLAMLDGLEGLPAPVGSRSVIRNLRRRLQLPGPLRYAVSSALEWLEEPTQARVQSVLWEVGGYRGEREASSQWERWRWPACSLAEAVLGCATGVVESTLLTASRYLAPSTSRWGRDQAGEGLRKAIAADLIPWALT